LAELAILFGTCLIWSFSPVPGTGLAVVAYYSIRAGEIIAILSKSLSYGQTALNILNILRYNDAYKRMSKMHAYTLNIFTNFNFYATNYS